MKNKIHQIAIEMNKSALERTKVTLTQIDAVLLEYLEEYGVPYTIKKGESWTRILVCGEDWGHNWKWKRSGKGLDAVPVECRLELQNIFHYRSKLINTIYDYQREIRYCEYIIGLPFSDTAIQPEIVNNKVKEEEDSEQEDLPRDNTNHPMLY